VARLGEHRAAADRRLSPVETWPRVTIAETVSLRGPGAMRGGEIEVRLMPWEDGIIFVRTDTGCRTKLNAEAASVGASWSRVGVRSGEINLVEHLLAALAAEGITDVAISVNGPEIPLLDGSAAPWAELIRQAGRQPIGGVLMPYVVTQPVVKGSAERGQLVAAYPYPRWRVIYTLDWDHPLVGLQTAHFDVGHSDFHTDLAAARTFALAEEAAAAKAAGLFAAATEENLIVIFDDYFSTEPALPEPFARHKIVDLIGDLYTLGRPVAGLFVAYNSGHALNHELVHEIAAQQSVLV